MAAVAAMPDEPTAPEAESCAAPEVAALQQRLEAKQDICRQLREQIEACHTERDATRSACTAGFAAAREQMVQMQAELAAARQLQAAAVSEGGEGRRVEQTSHVDAEMEQARKQALELRARALRHELLKWQHKTEGLVAQQKQQQAETARLQHSFTHAGDVLESTRNAAHHAKIDLELTPAAVSERQLKAAVPLSGGGHGCVEANAERYVRERTEAKNEVLAGKTKRLKGVFSAQQLLIHKLEKQLLKEEGALEHRSMQVSLEQQRHQTLKSSLRRRSDDAVAAALGFPLGGGSPAKFDVAGASLPAQGCPSPPPPSRGSRGSSMPPGTAGTVTSEPAIKQDLVLPPIET